MTPHPVVEIGAERTKPGTVAALVVTYFNSAQFRSLSPSTQATYRGILERFRADHGHRRVAHLARENAEMLGNRASTPAAANNWLRMVRMLMRLAVELGMRTDDPTFGIKPLRIRSDGFQIWRPDQIAAFRGKHAIGTRAARPRIAAQHRPAAERRRPHGPSARSRRHPLD